MLIQAASGTYRLVVHLVSIRFYSVDKHLCGFTSSQVSHGFTSYCKLTVNVLACLNKTACLFEFMLSLGLTTKERNQLSGYCL